MYHHARKLAAASLVVMAGFVASRLLGLVRNVVVAQQFGAGREYEAFIAALTIPDLVFQVLAGGRSARRSFRSSRRTSPGTTTRARGA